MEFVSHTGMADHEKVHIRIVHHDYNFFTAILWFLYKTFMTASATPDILQADGSFTRLL